MRRRAAYLLGHLAESNVDHLTANQHFGHAAQLQPENPTYFNKAVEIASVLGHHSDAILHRTSDNLEVIKSFDDFVAEI